jgi:hypothetical protein
MLKKFQHQSKYYQQPDGSLSLWLFGDAQHRVTAREVIMEAQRRGIDTSEVWTRCKTTGNGRDWQYAYSQPWFNEIKSDMLSRTAGRPVMVSYETVAAHRNTISRINTFRLICNWRIPAGAQCGGTYIIEERVPYCHEVMKVTVIIQPLNE